MKKTTEEQKRPPGRPPVAPEDRMRVGSLRMRESQWAKLAKLGGVEWLREKIDKAREKGEK